MDFLVVGPFAHHDRWELHHGTTNGLHVCKAAYHRCAWHRPPSQCPPSVSPYQQTPSTVEPCTTLVAGPIMRCGRGLPSSCGHHRALGVCRHRNNRTASPHRWMSCTMEPCIALVAEPVAWHDRGLPGLHSRHRAPRAHRRCNGRTALPHQRTPCALESCTTLVVGPIARHDREIKARTVDAEPHEHAAITMIAPKLPPCSSPGLTLTSLHHSHRCRNHRACIAMAATLMLDCLQPRHLTSRPLDSAPQPTAPR